MSNTLRCLVIGANGFIGSHLVDELVEAGYNVRAFDRYTQEPQFKSNPKVEVVKGDFFNEDDLINALNGAGYVFHSLSLTTPFTSDNDPFSDVDKNLRPTIKLFDLCQKANIKKVIYLSSGGAVYGHISEEQAANEDDATTPVSPYGIIKLTIENYLAYFNRKYDMDYLVYRLTNPYGPRQEFRNNQGVIPAFLEQINEKHAIKVFGDGNATRDYVFIRDVTRMMVRSFAQKTKYKTYNLGSGKQTSINDIIAVLKDVTKRDFAIDYQESPKTFLSNANISTKRFEEEFGEHSKTDLKSGMEQTVTEY